ncbi:hypothetical protein BDV98DRAFT_562304 [Pterulicium gracile]|uniref:Uncharacterized protein n=1 Tax=Pterulicium gracile TaxID=1884261 RepID=A0A5C3QRI6_9AGAR|nr:hypothetical protein BDV98DRAFT_562304 [Pterula gracilis]
MKPTSSSLRAEWSNHSTHEPSLLEPKVESLAFDSIPGVLLSMPTNGSALIAGRLTT